MNYVDVIQSRDEKKISAFIETWSGTPDRKKALIIFGFDEFGNHSTDSKFDNPTTPQLLFAMSLILTYMHGVRSLAQLQDKGYNLLAGNWVEILQQVYKKLPNFARW